MRHIHLHPLGGAAGDMFVACLLDAFPDLTETVLGTAQSVSGVTCRLTPHDDETLTGARFEVDATHHHHHHHTSWRDIRLLLEDSSLPPEARAHAIGIFATLAEAEGRVHGVPAESVTFHEVGALDSIADIVAAASVIAALGPVRWSVGPLPIGGGTVPTAHGIMPVPTPATALLLEGFVMQDDGINGERITPTGAAILRYLGAGSSPGHGTLRGSGTGFGSRSLPGIANCLRALVFDADGVETGAGHRELAVISFEIDDQSGEDLATGLDRVRAMPGVHDVVQMPAFGKKSRMAVHVQVLARPDVLEDVVDGCFRETTTIGLRTHRVVGRALPRQLTQVDIDGHAMTLKLVQRPSVMGGATVTAKAESDHLRPVASHAARTRLRRQAEQVGEATDLDQPRNFLAP